MKLSVIIPVYNEEATIEKVIRRVKQANPKLDIEILVVDDGSTDQTAEKVRAMVQPGLILLEQGVNRGKGAAIRTALERATGDVTVIQDADLEYDPYDYPLLLKPMESGASIVYGSRLLNKKNARAGWSYYLGGRLLSFVANQLYGLSITDEPTCYKVFTTSILREMKLECEGFEFCPEVTAKAALMGHQIVEVPISYYPRTEKEGKKIRWRDGLVALWVLLKNRFC